MIYASARFKDLFLKNFRPVLFLSAEGKDFIVIFPEAKALTEFFIFPSHQKFADGKRLSRMGWTAKKRECRRDKEKDGTEWGKK